jgi:hypothetical protein
MRLKHCLLIYSSENRTASQKQMFSIYISRDLARSRITRHTGYASAALLRQTYHAYRRLFQCARFLIFNRFSNATVTGAWAAESDPIF